MSTKQQSEKKISLLLLLIWTCATLVCAYFIKSDWAVIGVFVIVACQLGLLPEKLINAFSRKESVIADDRSEKETNGKKAYDEETFGNEIGIINIPSSRNLHSYEQMEKKTIEAIRNIIPGFAFETGKKVFVKSEKGSHPLFPDGFFQRNGEHFLLEIKLARPSNRLRLLHSLDSYVALYENKKTPVSFYLALVLDNEEIRKSFEQVRRDFEEKFESRYKDYNAFLLWVDLSPSPSEKKPSK